MEDKTSLFKFIHKADLQTTHVNNTGQQSAASSGLKRQRIKVHLSLESMERAELMIATQLTEQATI